MRIAELSNEQLLASLRTVVGDERRLVARVLALLAEVEHRRIHLARAASSMFEFCTQTLGLSEDQACRRIAVARLGRRFPQLIEAIAVGRMHLSGVYQLRELYTDTNVEEIIAEASGKSRAELDRLIARRAPKPDVPESIRKLPAQAALGVMGLPTGTAAAPVAAMAFTTEQPDRRGATAPAAQLAPLSPERYRVTLTIDAVVHDKLERVRRLMRHRNPSGDLAPVLDRALDLLLEDLEKELRGKVKNPRKSKGTTDPSDVTRETRREVHQRDASQCTFVSDDGVRCAAREFLELEHRQARALGGTGATENIRILCRAHNQFEAEQTFGREHMEKKRRKRKPSPAAPNARPSDDPQPSMPLQGNLRAGAPDAEQKAQHDDRVRQPASQPPPRTDRFAAQLPTGPSDDRRRDSTDVSTTTSSRETPRGASVSSSAPAASDPRQRGRFTAESPPRKPGSDESVPSSASADPRQRGRFPAESPPRKTGSDESVPGSASGDPRRRGFTAESPPRKTVRSALVRLGFRGGETDKALDALPALVWSSPLEEIIRAALMLLG